MPKEIQEGGKRVADIDENHEPPQRSVVYCNLLTDGKINSGQRRRNQQCKIYCQRDFEIVLMPIFGEELGLLIERNVDEDEISTAIVERKADDIGNIAGTLSMRQEVGVDEHSNNHRNEIAQLNKKHRGKGTLNFGIVE